MDKEDVMHVYSEIWLSHEKEWSSAVCRDMDKPRDIHTEWSKSEWEKQVS